MTDEQKKKQVEQMERCLFEEDYTKSVPLTLFKNDNRRNEWIKNYEARMRRHASEDDWQGIYIYTD